MASADGEKSRVAGPPDPHGHRHTIAKLAQHSCRANREHVAAFDPPTVLKLIAAASDTQRQEGGKVCSGCEGHPSPENNPCAVCGTRRPAPEASPAGAFAIGCRVQPKGGGLVVGELIAFNADQTGARIHWNDGHEVWKNLKNLEVIAPSPPAPPSAATPAAAGESGELREALENILATLSPLTVFGRPVASLDTMLARRITEAVVLIGNNAALRASDKPGEAS